MISVITCTYNTPPEVLARTWASLKACAACGQTKQAQEFSKNKTLKSGLNSSCKECIKARSKIQYQKHLAQRLQDKSVYRETHRADLREKAAEYRKQSWDVNKLWRTSNREKIRLTAARRRARVRGNTIGLVTVRDVKSMLTKPCTYCGNKSEHIDHVIPLARGGSHSLGNLAPACQPCNLQKNKKFVIEWKASKRDISLHVNVQQHA